MAVVLRVVLIILGTSVFALQSNATVNLTVNLTISGYVFNNSNNPLANVSVALESWNFTVINAATNGTGYYAIINISNGTYDILANDFDPYLEQYTIIELGEDYNISITVDTEINFTLWKIDVNASTNASVYRNGDTIMVNVTATNNDINNITDWAVFAELESNQTDEILNGSFFMINLSSGATGTYYLNITIPANNTYPALIILAGVGLDGYDIDSSIGTLLGEVYQEEEIWINITEEEQNYTAPDIMISELYYNTSNDLEKQFIELTVRDDANISDINLSGWYITNYDENASLPDILNLSSFDYIAIHMNAGINDLDASDGNATIYLNRTSPMLNNKADEVGLYDNNNKIYDFVRYNGGNSSIVEENWSITDLGIRAANINESIQIHGPDLDNSSNWVSSPATKADPNIYAFIISTLTSQVPVHLRNGLNYPIALNLTRGINITVIRASLAVSLAEARILEEMMNFSYNFYMSKGFNEPEVGVDGIMEVRVTKNNGFGAATQANGDITVDIGGSLNNLEVASFIKWNIEHEFLHTIQFGRHYANGTYAPAAPFNHDVRTTPGFRFAFLSDGAADYWGLEISKAQYNVTEGFVFNASVNISKIYAATFGSIPYNITDIVKNFDINLTAYTTGSGLEVYTHGYLFVKFLQETFGEDILVLIHNFTQNNITGSGSDVVGQDAIISALQNKSINATFVDLWVNWSHWIYENYGSILGYTIDKVFNGSTVAESDSLRAFGTDFERINMTTNNTFNVQFDGDGSREYAVTIIRIRHDGTQEKEVRFFSGSTGFTIYNDYEQIIIIKSQVNDTIHSNYNLTLTDANDGSVIDRAVIENSTVRNSTVYNSTIKDSIVNYSTKNHSTIIQSRNQDSSITYSTERNSTVYNSTLRTADVSNSSIDRSIVENSTIENSTVYNSTLINTTVINSTVRDSTKINAVIINSINLGSTVANANETNSIIRNSTINNSTITDSTINSSTKNSSIVIRSTNTDSTATNSSEKDSTIYNSTLQNSNVSDSAIGRSNISNSDIMNSSVDAGDVSDSSIKNSTSLGDRIRNSSIDSSDTWLSNITNSTIDNSRVWLANVTDSNIDDSDADGSNIENSNIQNSTIYNSTIINSTVINSTVRDSTKINAIIINSVNLGSRVANVNETNSVINNSVVNDSTINGSRVTDSSIRNSTLANKTLNDINVSDTLISTICGGGTPCVCDDTILNSRIFSWEDFPSPCDMDGLLVGSDDLVVDCNGFQIGGLLGSSTGIYMNNRYRVTVNNCVITQFVSGISLTGSGYNNLINNRLTDNYFALDLYFSPGNRLYSNIIDYSDAPPSWVVGMFITDSGDTIIRNNRVFLEGITAIKLDPATNITLVNNTIMFARNAILLLDINNSLIANNTIIGGNDTSKINLSIENRTGIWMNRSFNNTIRNNILTNNTIGINIQGGDNNRIYFNEFVNSIFFHANDIANNSWNSSSGGNYWGGILLLDIVDSDSDGIGDSGSQYPYNATNGANVTGNVNDRMPFTTKANITNITAIIYNISLLEGWNLISVPFLLDNYSIEDVFNSTNYSSIFTFNSSSSKWLMNKKNNISISSLFSVNNKDGYWIKMADNGTFSFNGSAPNATNMTLKKGWNLIGYPSLASKQVNETFNVNFTTLLTYQNNKWISYNKNKSSALNTLANMTPGYGYWVRVENDAEWAFNGTFATG